MHSTLSKSPHAHQPRNSQTLSFWGFMAASLYRCESLASGCWFNHQPFSPQGRGQGSGTGSFSPLITWCGGRAVLWDWTLHFSNLMQYPGRLVSELSWTLRHPAGIQELPVKMVGVGRNHPGCWDWAQEPYLPGLSKGFWDVHPRHLRPSMRPFLSPRKRGLWKRIGPEHHYDTGSFTCWPRNISAYKYVGGCWGGGSLAHSGIWDCGQCRAAVWKLAWIPFLPHGYMFISGLPFKTLFQIIFSHKITFCNIPKYVHEFFLNWSNVFPPVSFLKKILFIYSWETQRERERSRDIGRGRSSHWGPDAGLDPRTLGSHPEPKADTQPLSHPGAPWQWLFNWKIQ